VDERRVQERLADRLQELGIEVELQPGGRCLLGRLPFAGDPLLTPGGPFGVAAVEFCSVGGHRIKCLRPAALFQLPLISIAGCADAAEIEARIRAAWIDLMAHSRVARETLDEAGVAVEADWNHAGLWWSLGLAVPDDHVRWLRERWVAVPSRGPLGGRALRAAAERLAEWPVEATSGAELAIAITAQMEARAQSLDEEDTGARRRRSLAEADTASPLHPVFRGRDHQVLLVGAKLSEDVTLHAALRRRGFRLTLTRTANDARRAFDQSSFEVVLTDAVLDRAEGLELIPTLADVPGIGELPVVLVDDRARESRRAAARALGAAGYLVRPLDPDRLAPGLEKLMAERPQRRFDRIPRRLAVSWEDGADGITSVVGRLGMFVTTERHSPTGSLETVALALPETGERVRIDVETLYQVDAIGDRDPGIGVRIRAFPDGDETVWIDYLSDVS
jgi:two-component system chemotaxis response regulator CheY